MKKGTRLIPGAHRPGLSLMEVLVAMAIFVLTMGVLVHMVNQANERAFEVQQQGQAAQLCRAKLAEASAGALPLTSQSEAPLDEDPAWVWSMDAEQMGEVQGLWRVTVRVSRPQEGGFAPVAATLSQLVLDPSLRGNATDSTPPISSSTPEATGQASTTSGGGTSGGSTGGSTGGSSGQPSGGGSPAPQPSAPRGPSSTPAPRGPSR